MTDLRKLALLLVPLALSACATYESQPIYHSILSAYPGLPAPYYPSTVYQVPPVPVYVGPVYVDPTPLFNFHLQSDFGHFGFRHSRRDGRGLRNGSGHQGGAGWSGSVWNR